MLLLLNRLDEQLLCFDNLLQDADYGNQVMMKEGRDRNR